MQQIITNTEPWVLIFLGTMYIFLLSILLSSLWDFLTGKRDNLIIQEIYFGKYSDIIEFCTSAGPLIGLFSTNLLGSFALQKAAPVLSGGANGSTQMVEMFNAIASAMGATSLGIGVALTGFLTKMICTWIYDVEPLKSSEEILNTSGDRYFTIKVPIKQVWERLQKIYSETKKDIARKGHIDTQQIPVNKYEGIPLSKSGGQEHEDGT